MAKIGWKSGKRKGNKIAQLSQRDRAAGWVSSDPKVEDNILQTQ